MADWSQLLMVFMISLLHIPAKTSTVSTSGLIDFTTDTSELTTTTKATDAGSTIDNTISTLSPTDITTESFNTITTTIGSNITLGSENSTSAYTTETVTYRSTTETDEITQYSVTSQETTPDEVSTSDITEGTPEYTTSPVTVTSAPGSQTTLQATQKPNDNTKVIAIAVGVAAGVVVLALLIALITVIACKKRGGNYNVLNTKQKFDNPLYGSTVTYQNPAMIPDFDAPPNHTPDPRV